MGQLVAYHFVAAGTICYQLLLREDVFIIFRLERIFKVSQTSKFTKTLLVNLNFLG